ncbi:citryl-CoA lyase [Emcibacter sp.]|uniref:citryl-CoA lyase n=1 Tax=Emcibacter sp. TaxID=1979954 RepID=UPI003A8FE46C
MRIGKQNQPFSAISTSTPETITVRGKDLCKDLIGKIDFTEYFWLLVTGTEPTPTQRFFADAVLVSIAEHGLVPSVVAARMTYAAAPEAFQGAVASGLLGCGSVVLGSAEVCGRFISELVDQARSENLEFEEAARRGVQALRAEKKAIPGFGHPLHADGDPRGNLLLKLAEEKEVAGSHIRMLYAVRKVIPEIIGRDLPINVNGAIPTVMLDVGFPLDALKGISLLARTASLIGHLQEEAERPIGFILSNHAAEAISYDGPE